MEYDDFRKVNRSKWKTNMERVLKTFFDQFDGQRVSSRTTQKSSVNFEFDAYRRQRASTIIYRNGGRI